MLYNYWKAIFKICILLLSISMMLEGHAFGCDIFTPVVVDSTGNVGKYTSIAADCNHKAHISYYDEGNRNLNYATNSSGSWLSNVLDSYSYTGKYTSIATDSNNKIHISYYLRDLNAEYQQGVLKYATNASGSWASYNVDSTSSDEDNGKYTSVAVDSNNRAHISYYSPGKLKYATSVSGSWFFSTYTVDPNVNLYGDFADEPGTSIAVDSNNKVHISYINIDNNDCQWQPCPSLHWAGDACKVYIKYATNKNGYWSTETIYDYYGDTNYLYPPSIAIDSNNKVHIAFTFCDLCYDKLYYATNAGGSWYVSKWDDPCVGGGIPPCVNENAASWDMRYPGLFPSIAIDPNNKIHISHSEWSHGRLLYTTNAGGNWSAYAGDSESGYIKDTSIVYDQKVHIAYYEEDNKDLLYTTCPNIPDLATTYISNPPTSAYRGSSFSVTDTVRNNVPPCGAGTRVGSTITRYRLSLDSTIGPSDPLLTGSRYVPSLAGGASSTGTITVTIPTSLAPGTYYLGACADSGYNISEKNESNCRASTTTIQVY